MRILWAIPVLLAAVPGLVAGADAQTISRTMEGGMDIEITHPEHVIAGRESSFSILIRNNGWEDKQDISFGFSSQDGRLVAAPAELIVEELSQGGSYGGSIDLSVSEDANPGVYFLNVRYSQVLVANNETPQPAVFHDIAIPIMLKSKPSVTIHTVAPESIFAAAEFPIEVTLASEDIDIRDVSVRIIPPDDVGFRGETLHTFSVVERGSPVTVISRIVTAPQQVSTEYKLPFEIVLAYTDDLGEQKTDSKTVPLVLRPRVFMELTTEGGIWIGDFFIAPYVSLGTIIGIPAGALLTLLIRRRTARPRRKAKRSR